MAVVINFEYHHPNRTECILKLALGGYQREYRKSTVQVCNVHGKKFFELQGALGHMTLHTPKAIAKQFI